MEKRKLVITHNISKEHVQQVKSLLPDWEIVVGKDRSIWEKHISDAEIIAGWKKGMDKDCLSGEVKLRWLQSWSAGVNNLPLEKLQDYNITVTAANGVHAYPISETIFALMLSFTRKMHQYVRNQLEAKWDHSNLKLEIHKKTLGLIGVGAIGKETAKIAKAFGMTVLGVRHSGKETEFVDKMYTTEQLNTMLPLCDFVVVALPLTPETKRLLKKEQFALMKETAFFINIGRGDIVDETAMITALQNGDIAGAGLDVFEQEPLPETNPLWKMENVIITPHSAGATEHYNERVMEKIFLPNLKSYLQNEKLPVNLVDYTKGY